MWRTRNIIMRVQSSGISGKKTRCPDHLDSSLLRLHDVPMVKYSVIYLSFMFCFFLLLFLFYFTPRSRTRIEGCELWRVVISQWWTPDGDDWRKILAIPLIRTVYLFFLQHSRLSAKRLLSCLVVLVVVDYDTIYILKPWLTNSVLCISNGVN